ncbi:TPA: hypothetical protein ACHKVS_005285, partial [Escherichia coli]
HLVLIHIKQQVMIKNIASFKLQPIQEFSLTHLQLFPFFINVKKQLCFGIKRKTPEDMSVTVLLSPLPLPWTVNAYHPYLS